MMRQRSIVTAGLALLMTAAPGWAADRDSVRKVGQANQLAAAGKHDQALEIYDEVGRTVTDAPELAYNRGVAYYRKGDRALAVDCFTKALLTRDIALEAKAKFNLGNCAYADALDKQDDLNEALSKLKVAIAYYKEAIAADPADMDAKVNIETAQLLMKHLLDQEKKRQEEKQKQDQQKDNTSTQPESQPADQQEPSEDQQTEQPESDQEQPNEQKEQDQQKGEQQQGEQKEGQQDQQAEQQAAQESKDEEGKKLEAQEQKSETKGDKQQEDEKDAQAQAVPVEMQEMTREEAEKLLQLIRDREQQRREAQLRLLRGRMAPVEKDW